MDFLKRTRSPANSRRPAGVRRSLLRRVPHPPAKDGDQQDGPLTDVQIGILSARASGKTRKEIAFALGLSLKTVEYHFAKIYRCLDITNDIELTHYAIHSGLIGLKQFVSSQPDGTASKSPLVRKAPRARRSDTPTL